MKKKTKKQLPVWLNVVLSHNIAAEVVIALHGISLTQHHLNALIFHTCDSLPLPVLPIQTHVEGSHAKTVTKDHRVPHLTPSPASCAPACAQSTTQHSQANDCECHQHPNFTCPRDRPTSETYSRPARHIKQTF